MTKEDKLQQEIAEALRKSELLVEALKKLIKKLKDLKPRWKTGFWYPLFIHIPLLHIGLLFATLEKTKYGINLRCGVRWKPPYKGLSKATTLASCCKGIFYAKP